jgi:hypothetical protein
MSPEDNMLFKSVKEGSITDLVKSLEKGADPNVKNKYGNTPLMWAASRGFIKTTKILIGAGADTGEKNHAGKTAVDHALKGGYPTVFSMLVLNGGARNISMEDMVLKILGRAGFSRESKACCAFAAAAAYYPKISRELDEIVSHNRSDAFEFAMDIGIIPAELIIATLERGKKFPLSFHSSIVKNRLVEMLLDLMDTNPSLVTSFIGKRIGKQMEDWKKENIHGIEWLFLKIINFLKHEKNAMDKKSSESQRDCDFFGLDF